MRERALDRLIDPLGAGAFCAELWDRRAAVVRGAPDKFERLFGTRVDAAGFLRLSRALAQHEAQIAALNQERGLDIGLPWRATFDQRAFLEGRGSNPFLQVRPEQVPALIAGGASVQLGSIDSLVFGPGEGASIAAVCEQIRAELNHPGYVLVGATLSPPGAGFGPHFDPTGAFLLQTAGKKRYSFTHAPVVPWPRGKAYLMANGAIRYRTAQERAAEAWEKPALAGPVRFDETVELGPGDSLYLPPGAAHSTLAGGDGAAVSLLLIFGQTSPRALFAKLLEEALGADERWRHLPAFLDSGTTGELPADVARFLDERLAEAQRALGALRGGGFEVARAWKRLSTDGVALPAPRSDGRPVERGDAFVVPPWLGAHLASGMRADGTRAASLFRGQVEVCVEGPWVDLLVRLARTERFVAAGAIRFRDDGLAYDWEELRACLAELLALGFIEREA